MLATLIGKKAVVGTTNQRNREEWLSRNLRSLPEGARLLDAGAGECANREYCAQLDYVSQDFSEYSGKGDERALQTGTWEAKDVDIISDITNIPVPDESFDAVLCSEVFEHLPDPVLAIRELARLLKPGGVLLLTAPFASLTHFSPYHYYSGFNRYFYERYLPELGLEIEELEENGNYFEWLAQELRRLDSMGKRYSGGGAVPAGAGGKGDHAGEFGAFLVFR